MAKRKGGTKFQWSKPKLQKLIGEAAATALKYVGADIRKKTQRSMRSNNGAGIKARAKPVFRIYGEKDGYPVVGAITQVPSRDKLTSWAPKAFLRNDIEYDYDYKSSSVVIGPSKVPWLNALHEFGGQRTYFVAIGKEPTAFYNGAKLKRSVMRKGAKGWGAYVGYVTDRPRSFKIGQRPIPARGFMKKGLDAGLAGIPPQFRNTIKGPHLV
jgi:hypothetical protein